MQIFFVLGNSATAEVKSNLKSQLQSEIVAANFMNDQDPQPLQPSIPKNTQDEDTNDGDNDTDNFIDDELLISSFNIVCPLAINSGYNKAIIQSPIQPELSRSTPPPKKNKLSSKNQTL